MNTSNQLELGLKGNAACRAGKKTAVRITRARWWFARMREAVDGAMEWQMENPVRPQPLFFTGSREKLNA